jgi:hypothetical protein
VSPGERRIPLGPLVGTLGAVMLAVSLFLDWWDGTTAFEAFEVLDLVLLTLAGATAAGLLAGAGLPTPVPERAAFPLAAVALAIVLSQLVNDPPLILNTLAGHATGIWLALAGAVLMTVGSLVAGSSLSLAVDVRRRDDSP